MKHQHISFFGVLFCFSVIYGQVSEQDSMALVALYNYTNGPNWNDNTNWLTAPVSDWFGVTVSDDRVSQIDLRENLLEGQIPTEIGNLSALTICYLNVNELSGSIPSTLGQLNQLTVLHFGENELEGQIPAEIGNLSLLTRCSLNDNELTGSIPSALGQLNQLESLALYGNHLNGTIPSSLGNLSQLTFINLGENQLTGTIPDEIWQLTNLEYISLYENQLHGTLSAQIGTLLNLKGISISMNQFEGTIPSEIGNLTSLRNLDLFANQFSGPVPESFINLENLERCHLFNNQFTDLPDLSSIGSLEVLKIQNNRFTFKDIEPHLEIDTFEYAPQDSVGEAYQDTLETGSTLSIFSTVTGENNQYQWFRNGFALPNVNESEFQIDAVSIGDGGLYTCEITNTLAPDLTLYRRPINITIEWSGFHRDSLVLQALYNSTDGANWTNHTGWFTSPLSNDWYGITIQNDRVSKIDLDGNNLSGEIPAQIGDLDSLDTFQLQSNSLSGTIPSVLCDLQALADIRLGRNQLTGSIPDSIGKLKGLLFLMLNSNAFTGPIPASIGQLDNLIWLDLSSNDIEGGIPSQIGNLQKLMVLSLGDNLLSGPIPPEIGSLINLERLHLSVNQLSGPIPPQIGSLEKLQWMELVINELDGSIPEEIGNLNNLEYLNLARNRFSGSIPETIGNMNNLQDLYFSSNSLEGLIPDTLGSLSDLTGLGLDRNRFAGEVTESLTRLAKLSYLTLYSNQLTGIPDFSDLDSLQNLEVQENRLTFEDIEPNLGITGFLYIPQDSVGEAQDTTAAEGDSLSFSVFMNGNNVHYQWTRNEEILAGSDSSVLVFDSIALSDSGTYICQMTSPSVPDLILYTYPIHIIVNPKTAIDKLESAIPEVFALKPNTPNPFNPVTKIEYHLPVQADVTLVIYNSRGEQVRQLVRETQSAGIYQVDWNGQHASGHTGPSGLYFIRFHAQTEHWYYSGIRKMMLLK